MGRPIEVVGSLNIDLVTITPRVPAGGETIRATSFSQGFGGKGANQAVAAARMLSNADRDGGISVSMIGAVGDDDFGRSAVAQLRQERIIPDAVKVIRGQSTGTSLIIVEEKSGENRILFNPGANFEVTPNVTKLEDNGRQSLVIFQLETPHETVMHCLRESRALSKETILNPAPASIIPDEHLRNVDHLIVNETEASILSGVPERELASSLDRVADIFLSKGVKYVIITLGSQGVFWKTAADANRSGKSMPAHKVKPVDTTAAGDTFVGAYAACLARSTIHPDAAAVEGAIRFANKAAALSVQKHGAQASIPYLAEMNSAA